MTHWERKVNELQLAGLHELARAVSNLFVTGRADCGISLPPAKSSESAPNVLCCGDVGAASFR